MSFFAKKDHIVQSLATILGYIDQEGTIKYEKAMMPGHAIKKMSGQANRNNYGYSGLNYCYDLFDEDKKEPINLLFFLAFFLT